MNKCNANYLVDTSSITCFSVLIFDSGIGGLAIYDKLQRLKPNLHYMYVFDNAAFPYGEKNKTFIVNRVLKIITAVQKRQQLALAVIACNTASTISLPILRKKFSFPVVGVIPAIKLAARLTVNGTIGLLATRSTINSIYLHKLITRYANKCNVKLIGSSELVELAEGKLRGKVVKFEKLHQILKPWLHMIDPPDTVILGCTHFTFLREELLAVLPNILHLIDSGSAVARHTALLLEHKVPADFVNRPRNAFCIKLTVEVERLLPVLMNYGFETLEQLII